MSRASGILTKAAAILVLGTVAMPGVVIANEGGAFIGGMLTSRVLTNMHQRTQAEQQQAYYAQQSSQQQQQPVRQAAPAASAKLTPEQRIAQLDKLAAGGYITPAEYKQKKQAIIGSM